MDPKKIAPFFWIFILFLLQNALGNAFELKAPILLLAGLLFYALSEGPFFGAILGAYAGLLLEIFGLGRMGAEILVFSAAGLVFGQTARTFFRESLLSQFLFPVLAFYFVVISRFIIDQASSGAGFDISLAGAALLPYDVAMVFASTPVIFFVLRKVSYTESRR